MKYAICLALCLILAAVPASAAGTDVLDEQRQSLEVDELERAAQEELDGMDLTLDGDWQDNLAQLLDTGTEELGGVVKKAVRSCVLLLIIVLLCTLGETVTQAGEARGLSVTPLAGTLAVTAVAVADVHSLLGMGTSAISSITTFSNVLLPVVATVTAATGAITGAAGPSNGGGRLFRAAGQSDPPSAGAAGLWLYRSQRGLCSGGK